MKIDKLIQEDIDDLNNLGVKPKLNGLLKSILKGMYLKGKCDQTEWIRKLLYEK